MKIRKLKKLKFSVNYIKYKFIRKQYNVIVPKIFLVSYKLNAHVTKIDFIPGSTSVANFALYLLQK